METGPAGQPTGRPEIVNGTPGAGEDPQGAMTARLDNIILATAIQLPGEGDRWALFHGGILPIVNIVSGRPAARAALANLAGIQEQEKVLCRWCRDVIEWLPAENRWRHTSIAGLVSMCIATPEGGGEQQDERQQQRHRP